MALPERAAVVVIGGGVIGTSIAFHLAEAGVRDVVLVDGGSLGAGSTSKAAGGVRAMFTDAVNIELGRRSLDAFADFGFRPGQDIDLHQDGYLFLLDDENDVATMAAAVDLQNELGVPSRMIDPAEAVRLSPYVNPDGLFAAAFSPTGGHCSPESVVLGYAGAARRAGAVLVPHCAVNGFAVIDGARARGPHRAGRHRHRHGGVRGRSLVGRTGRPGRSAAARDPAAAPDPGHRAAGRPAAAPAHDHRLQHQSSTSTPKAPAC